MNDFRFILNPEDVKRLDRISARFPKLVVRQWVGTATHITNRLRKTLKSGGGRDGVPAFAPRSSVTLRLGKTAWGGKLKRTITKWGNPFRGGQYWGFPGGLAEWFGEHIQTSELRPYRPGERRFLQWQLRTRNIGDLYRRPARPLIAPFAGEVPGMIRKEFVPRVMRALNKELKK